MSDDRLRRPALESDYLEYVDGQDSTAFAKRVAARYTVGTLQRLAAHPTREVRRGAVLALGLLGDYESNHTMGRALHDEDRTVRLLAEEGIRVLWTRCGDPLQREQLNAIIQLNTRDLFQEAADRATDLIERAPALAEAWNQRAIARFGMSDFVRAIRDCHQALELNPYHFAAASGMAQAYLKLGNPVSALESFRRALRLNPGLEGVRAQVVRLTRLIEDK